MSRSTTRGPGTTGHRRRPRAAAAPVLALIAIVVLALTPSTTVRAASVGATGPRAAAPTVTPDRNLALLTLTHVSPTVVTPSSDVTITGTLTAPLTGPLTTPRVRVVLDDEIRSRAELDRWASGRTPAAGDTVAEISLPTIAAGSERPFSIVVPADALSSPEAYAVLPISIEAVQEGASAPIGVTRTFLAWNSRKEFEPIQVATLMPVTLDPVVALFSQEQGVRDGAWERVLGPTSRISRLVDGTADSSVDLAVDPAVFGPTAASVPGSTGSSGSSGAPGTPTPNATSASPGSPGTSPSSPTSPTATTPAVAPTPDGSATTAPSEEGTTAGPDAVVSDLADALAARLRDRPVLALPYADADVAASSSLNPSNAQVRSLVSRSAVVAEVLGKPARADIAWPVDGLMPNGREKALQTIWSGSTVKKVAGIVVDERSISSASPFTATARRVATGGTRLLGYDARLSGLLPKRTEPTPVLSIQRYLAETLVLLDERSGTPRSSLVVASRTYDPDPAALSEFLEVTSSVPWVEPVPVTALLSDRDAEQASPQQRPAKPPPSAAPPPTLTTARLAQMTRQRSTMLSVSEVLADGAIFAATYGELLDELTSARWRWAPAGWTALGTSVSADITAATKAIRVVPRSFNLLAENGTLQVTVVNGLAYDVEDIHLLAVPNNPRVQIIEQPGPISIEPGSRTNVPLQVAAVAAGKVEITIYLTTADGTVIGTEGVIKVQANPLDSTIYWVGGVLAGTVLLAGLARAALRGTSRIDEIEDIEAVTAAHATGEDMNPR